MDVQSMLTVFAQVAITNDQRLGVSNSKHSLLTFLGYKSRSRYIWGALPGLQIGVFLMNKMM